MTLYLITYHKFNHEGENRVPLDDRFLKSDKKIVYYLIDEETPAPLKGKSVLFEKKIEPLLYEAGGKHFGEWSFLLAEKKHSFCQYPFFMTSSRFYEKNSWLYRDLNQEWDTLFSLLREYGWGYLPSYNQPLYWVDLSKTPKREGEGFWPFHPKAFSLIEDLYGVNVPKDYRYTPFLFCNYIGFQSREHLLRYVQFYEPLIHYFFDEKWSPRRDFSLYLKNTGRFRNEKSFAFLLELFSHLFFFKEKQPYMALHYDGYYAIDEASKKWTKLERFPLPLTLTLRRSLGKKKTLLKEFARQIYLRILNPV